MRTAILFFMLAVAACFSRDVVVGRVAPAIVLPPSAEEIAKAKAADLADKQKYFVPRDPWRMMELQLSVDGKLVNEPATMYAKGGDWMQFYGEVTQVLQDGVTIKGWFGPPLDFEHGWTNMVFTVKNFPYKVKTGITLRTTGNFVARLIYLPRSEYSRDQIARLDYGFPTNAPGRLVVKTPAMNARTNGQK